MVVHMVLIPGHVFKFIKFQELLKLRPCCQWRGPRAFRIYKADTRRQAATLSDPADLAEVGLVSHTPVGCAHSTLIISFGDLKGL